MNGGRLETWPEYKAVGEEDPQGDTDVWSANVIVEPEQDQRGDLEGYVHEKEELVPSLVEASERSEVDELIGDESKEV